MVTFNGISISDIAPIYLGNVEIEAPRIIVTSQDKPISTGDRYVRSKYAPRRVFVPFSFSRGTQAMIADWMQSIYKWAHSAELCELTTPNRPGQYAMAKCTKLPSVSLIGNRKDKMEIEFTIYDAMFYSDELKAVACGTSFEIDGVDIASGYIEDVNVAEVTDPEWVLDGDEAVTISGTIAAGTIKVDLDEKSVYLGTVSQMTKVDLASRFFDLTPGVHVITGDGTLYWRERWI